MEDSKIQPMAAGSSIVDEQNVHQHVATEEEASAAQAQQVEMDKFAHNFALLDLAVSDANADANAFEVYISWIHWVLAGNGTEAQRLVCLDEFLPRTIRLILTSRTTYALPERVNLFIQSLCRFAMQRAKLLCREGEIPAALADCLALTTNPCACFYLNNSQEMMEEATAAACEEDAARVWLSASEVGNLRVGDSVFLAGDDDGAEGEIVEISPTNTECKIKLLRLSPHSSGEETRDHVEFKWVSKEPQSFRSAAAAAAAVSATATTRNPQEHPRFRQEVCTVGALCDVQPSPTTSSLWYQACVVQVLQLQSERELKLHVLGFTPERGDVVLSADSPHIAPLNSRSHARRGALFVCPTLVEEEDVEAGILFGDFSASTTAGTAERILPRRSKPSRAFFIANMRALVPEILALTLYLIDYNLKLSIVCLGNLLPYLSEEVTHRMAEQYPARVLHCVDVLTPQQLRNMVSKALVQRITLICRKLLLKCNLAHDCAIVERIRMAFCAKLLGCEMIMKRVDGLQLLNDLIADCKPSFAGGGKSVIYLNEQGYYSRQRVSACPSSQLAFWCVQQGFLRSFFFPPSRAHHELIKRSAPLIALLCEENMFMEDFGLIWQTACEADDEEISAASFAILGQCSHVFPASVKSEFKDKLVLHHANGGEEEDRRITNLLRELIQVSPELAEVACDALWKDAFQRGKEDASMALEQALRVEHAGGESWEAALRVRVVKRICGEDESLLANCMVLRLLRAAVESFPASDDAESSSRAILVERLCREDGLVDKLVRSFASKAETAVAGIKFRLDFLSFILRSRTVMGGRALDFATLEQLWAHLVHQQQHENGDIFFNWLQKICRATFAAPQGNDSLVLARGAMRHLFDKIELECDFHSSFAFRVFQACFLGVNLELGTIARNAEGDLLVSAQGAVLLGEDTLWSIALLPERSSELVAESAAHYISFLHTRSSESFSWEALGQRVTRVFSTRGADLGRACSLATYFLVDNELEFAALVRGEYADQALWERIRPHSSLGPYAPVCFVSLNNAIKGSAGFGKQFRIDMRANDSVGKLRALVAAEHSDGICAAADEVRLFAGGSEVLLKNDAKSVIAMSPAAPLLVACKKLTAAAAPVIRPERIGIASPPSIDWLDAVSLLLLNALGREEQSSPAWTAKALKLLDLLPTSRSVAVETLQARAPFGQDLYRIAYELEIVQDELHRVAAAVAAPSVESDELIKHFFPRLQHLLLHTLCARAKTAGARLIKPLHLCLSLLRDITSACCCSGKEDSNAQATSPSWPVSKLAVWREEDATRIEILSQLDAVALQQALLGTILPLALAQEPDQAAAALTRLCFDLWAKLLLLLPDAALFDAVPMPALQHVIAHCDARVGDGLLAICDLLPARQRNAVLDACVLHGALPTENQDLLYLVERLLATTTTRDGSEEDHAALLLPILLGKLEALPAREQFPPDRVEAYSDAPDLHSLGLLRLITAAINSMGSASASAMLDMTRFDCVAHCVLLDSGKCQLPGSRSAAFECLLAICNRFALAGDTWFARLFKDAFDHQRFTHLPLTIAEGEGEELDTRSPLGFCGIVNLGATCYLNSLFQQLWVIPAIRHGLASLKLTPRGGDPVSSSSSSSSEDVDLELVLAMQNLFQQLSHSTRRTISLDCLAGKFRDEATGSVGLNPLEQQDAQEIFEKLCDRVDDCLHREHMPRLFSNALGVRIASRLVCLEDSSRANREDQGSVEWCLKVQLVPGAACNRLEDILARFVAGEVLQEFTWEEEEGSGKPRATLRTLKKQVIKSTSHTLAIHIARFQMNWDTQLCEKTNDRLQFPLLLDMSPYCEAQAGEATSLHFRLVGVLVHDGALLNSGHYYSFVQSRIAQSNTEAQWFCFNDAQVTRFDVERELDEAAFGGPTAKGTMRTHGAYMLFYERVGAFSTSASSEPGITPEQQRSNHDHRLACRLFDPALLQFLSARCMGGATRLGEAPSPPPPMATVTTEAKKSRTESEDLLDVVSSRFLTRECIAARTGNGEYFMSMSQALAHSLVTSPMRANSFLHSLQVTDCEFLLLLDVARRRDYRIGICFASLLAVAFRESDDACGETALRTTLFDYALVERALEQAQRGSDTQYWHTFNLVVESKQVLARQAFALNLLPIIFNALLGLASPASQFEFCGARGFQPRRTMQLEKEQIERTTNSGVVMPLGASTDNAILACVASAVAELHHDTSTQQQRNGELDHLAYACLDDLTSWTLLIAHVNSIPALDSLVSLLELLLALERCTARELAGVLARTASTAGAEAISRYYSAIAKLPSVSVAFFLGSNEQQHGFFHLIASNRSKLFAYSCITLFVERLGEGGDCRAFNEMVQCADVWRDKVESFLRNDSLAGSLEGEDLDRMFRCLEILAALDTTNSGTFVPPPPRSNASGGGGGDQYMVERDDLGTSSLDGLDSEGGEEEDDLDDAFEETLSSGMEDTL